MPRILAATFAPLVAGLWAARVAEFAAFDSVYFVLTISAAWGLLFLVAGALAPNRSGEWLTVLAELFGFAYAFALAMSTTLVISRSPWAVTLEIVSLLGLLSLHWAIRAHGAPRAWLTPLLAVAAALWIQAVFLRFFGPPGDLTLFDLTRTRWPALLSLLWASFGAALTIWGRRTSSRGLWVAGAALLIAATVKIVLLDFGTLGQLTNILAVIAAGLVFLLVGWLAPMPPASHEDAPVPHESTVVRAQEPPSAPQAPPGHDKWRAWVIAIVVTLIASLSQCRYSPLHKFERSRTTAPIQDTTFTRQLRQ
jgi:MFS family permease